ncbi:MAG: hypothetical protein JWP25_1801 [Bradyrhizobium sp.]|nr:hypothetical protein [Bradyrhizobium sp.]
MRLAERDRRIFVEVQLRQLTREIVSLPRSFETLQDNPRLPSWLAVALLDGCREVEVPPRLRTIAVSLAFIAYNFEPRDKSWIPFLAVKCWQRQLREAY